MKKIDFYSLDGRGLKTFLVVSEEMSVSRAAERLGVTQSAVSHTLDKLRLALGDPLFVRSGRGIAATERAVSLREPVRQMLDDLKGLTDQRVFDPSIGTLELTIAANDFQRDLIFPGLLAELSSQGVDLYTRFIPSGVAAANLLNQDRCQILLTPYPPEGPDFFQLRLFGDHLVCFYDSNSRKAPSTWEELAASDYIEVIFEDNASALNMMSVVDPKEMGQPRLTVSNFNAVSQFLRGSRMISFGASLMGKVGFDGMASTLLPFESDPLTMYLVWHRRNQTDPAHRWFRERVKQFVESNIKR